MSKKSNKNQRKGMLLAFTGIMFITPDSLLIRLANIDSWNLIFYRGFIPFLTILIGLLFIYKSSLIKKILDNGWHGLFFIVNFAITFSFIGFQYNFSVSNGPLFLIQQFFTCKQFFFVYFIIGPIFTKAIKQSN